MITGVPMLQEMICEALDIPELTNKKTIFTKFYEEANEKKLEYFEQLLNLVCGLAFYPKDSKSEKDSVLRIKQELLSKNDTSAEDDGVPDKINAVFESRMPKKNKKFDLLVVYDRDSYWRKFITNTANSSDLKTVIDEVKPRMLIAINLWC